MHRREQRQLANDGNGRDDAALGAAHLGHHVPAQDRTADRLPTCVRRPANIAEWISLEPGDRCLNIMPLFHIHGLMAGVMASLHAGACVICTPGFNALRVSSGGSTR